MLFGRVADLLQLFPVVLVRYRWGGSQSTWYSSIETSSSEYWKRVFLPVLVFGFTCIRPFPFRYRDSTFYRECNTVRAWHTITRVSGQLSWY